MSFYAVKAGDGSIVEVIQATGDAKALASVTARFPGWALQPFKLSAADLAQLYRMGTTLPAGARRVALAVRQAQAVRNRAKEAVRREAQARRGAVAANRRAEKEAQRAAREEPRNATQGPVARGCGGGPTVVLRDRLEPGEAPF